MRPMPLEREKLSDLVAQRLVQYIEENNLQPGDLLPTEKELAKCFDVGRTTVREGISKLKNAGLLQTVQGYGCVINEITFCDFFGNYSNSVLNQFVQFNPTDLQQIRETRLLFETYALQEYLHSAGTPDLFDLNILLRRMGKAVSSKDPELFITLDLDFHHTIIKLANNAILSQTYEWIMHPFLHETQRDISADTIALLQDEHYLILKGIQTKDASVVTVLENHLRH